MFKIINYLNRHTIYFLTFISIAIAIILIDVQPLKSQTNVTTSAVNEIPKEIVDLEQFSTTIAKLEVKWGKRLRKIF